MNLSESLKYKHQCIQLQTEQNVITQKFRAQPRAKPHQRKTQRKNFYYERNQKFNNSEFLQHQNNFANPYLKNCNEKRARILNSQPTHANCTADFSKFVPRTNCMDSANINCRNLCLVIRACQSASISVHVRSTIMAVWIQLYGQ